MKSQAYAPICHDGPCLSRLQPERDCFCEGFTGFFGSQTVRNDFQLPIFLSRVRIEVLGNVNHFSTTGLLRYDH